MTCLDGMRWPGRPGGAGVGRRGARIVRWWHLGTLLLAAVATPLASVAAGVEAADYTALMVSGLVTAIVIAQGSVGKAIVMTTAVWRLAWLAPMPRPDRSDSRWDCRARRWPRLHAAGNRPVRPRGDDRQLASPDDPMAARVERPGPGRARPAGRGLDVSRDGARLAFRRISWRRSRARLVRFLRDREEDVSWVPALGSGAIEGVAGPGRPTTPRRRPHSSAAHIRPSVRPRRCAAWRVDRARDPTRTYGHREGARTVLGPGREHVDRQRDAAGVNLPLVGWWRGWFTCRTFLYPTTVALA